MNRKSYFWLAAIAALLIASLACSTLGGGAPAATEAPAQTGGAAGGTGGTTGGGGGSTGGGTGGSTGGGASGYNTEFPLPSDVSNFTDLGNGQINFQTKMSLKDTIAFYREAFTKAGYTERELLTAITDTTFSMVFDGHSSGKAIVIQGVDLGGSTNVNIRLEDV